MSHSTLLRRALALGCLAALPLYAQQATKKTEVKKTETKKTETKTEAKSETKKTMSHRAMASGGGHTKVWNDTTRLAAILSDMQDQRANFNADAWRVSANEANMLANRIYAGAGGRSQARELRTHVREMRAAALKGDADGARSHASQALPFAYQLIDWSMPSKS